MDFVSGVSSTYDFSVYSRRQSMLSETREKPAASSKDDSASKTGDTGKTDSFQAEDTSTQTNSVGKTLSEDEQKKLEKLKARDLEVRQHEQAHQRAGAGIAGQPVYTYEAGPDGKQYAVGGSVSVDMSEGATPEATITKAGQIRRTALAPKDPSQQDMKIAQEASQMELEARSELMADAQKVSKAYASVQNISASKTPSSAQGVTQVSSGISSSGGTNTKSQTVAQGLTEGASGMVNPYTELAEKMSGNTAESVQIKASNSRKLDLSSGKLMDLFG